MEREFADTPGRFDLEQLNGLRGALNPAALLVEKPEEAENDIGPFWHFGFFGNEVGLAEPLEILNAGFRRPVLLEAVVCLPPAGEGYDLAEAFELTGDAGKKSERSS